MQHDSTFGGFGQGGPYTGSPYPLMRTDGVLSRRLFAYLIDFLVIGFLTILFGFLIGIAGFVTFGLTWMLYAVLIPATAILYSGITIGGPARSTLGMRMLGLVVADVRDGGPVGFWTGAAHAFLFYLAASTFLLLVADIVIGVFRPDSRLGHDLLLGLVVARRA